MKHSFSGLLNGSMNESSEPSTMIRTYIEFYSSRELVGFNLEKHKLCAFFTNRTVLQPVDIICASVKALRYKQKKAKLISFLLVTDI